jgi:mannose-1-phosphate guanylyltransferase/mannose-1-phosphate guanylyltransferase/mannose-6-phosphate isomerase
MSDATKIKPVILSGGSGTRLWPMSRQHHPKQLLPLASPVSMIRDTLARFSDPMRFDAPTIVTADALRFSVAEEVRLDGIEGVQIVLEPSARNTAPAIAAAALIAAETDPEAVLLVVPSDHVILDAQAFLAMVDQAAPAARDGYLVTFAMTPTRAETGYGYIHMGPDLDGHPGVNAVRAFVEKPDAVRAQRFLDEGGYFWNSGMFLFQAKSFLSELERLAPDILPSVREAVAGRKTDLDFIRLAAEPFAKAPSISVDYAVMERTSRAATVGARIGWTDVGNWAELWNIGAKDHDGNVLQGDVIALETTNSYVRSEHALVATLGVDNLVVVVTDDAVLISDRDRAQDVKLVVERLKADNRTEQASHTKVHRPWGYYQSIHNGDRFQVKRLSVKPGAQLSLQKHFHRAEHWVVVGGTALVTRDDQTMLLRENESVYIPLGSVHRLENPGKVPLTLIEVQSGSYLGEDDIVRIIDTYGRQ